MTTHDDVRAQTRALQAEIDAFRTQQDPRGPRAEAPARGKPTEVRSQFDDRRTVTIDVFGPNPLLEDARALSPGAAAAALAQGPAPTMFADGDLPPFTASGVPVTELRKVPWYARHAVAAADDASKVLSAIEHFAQDPDDPFGEYEHPGAHDYVARFRAWAFGHASQAT